MIKIKMITEVKKGKRKADSVSVITMEKSFSFNIIEINSTPMIRENSTELSSLDFPFIFSAFAFDEGTR